MPTLIISRSKKGLSLNEEIKQVANETLNNPAIQKWISGCTICMSIVTVVLPSILSIVGLVMGILASTAIYKKSKLEIRKLEKELREENNGSKKTASK